MDSCLLPRQLNWMGTRSDVADKDCIIEWTLWNLNRRRSQDTGQSGFCHKPSFNSCCSSQCHVDAGQSLLLADLFPVSLLIYCTLSRSHHLNLSAIQTWYLETGQIEMISLFQREICDCPFVLFSFTWYVLWHALIILSGIGIIEIILHLKTGLYLFSRRWVENRRPICVDSVLVVCRISPVYDMIRDPLIIVW